VGETIEPLPHTPAPAQAEDWVTFTIWQRLPKLKEALYSITLADLYYDARSWQAAQGEATSFCLFELNQSTSGLNCCFNHCCDSGLPNW